MKQYKVILKDGREAFVNADSHELEFDVRRFSVNGKMIPDVFFYENQVVGISIEIEDLDDAYPGMEVG